MMPSRQTISLLVLALVCAACSPEAAEETTTTTAPSTTTTTTQPTTTTLDPDAVASDTCDALKVAVFDLEARIAAGLEELDIASESDLSDTVVGRLVVEEMVAFYDELARIADAAPESVAEPLVAVSESADPWREALDFDDRQLEHMLEELDPAALDSPELTAAVTSIDAWTADECGATVAVGAEEIIFTTVFAAMLGSLGSVFGGMGDDFPGPSRDDSSEPDGLALAFGDDPSLDALYLGCGNGDGQACRDLEYSSYGEYEMWGRTCGASIPLRPYLVVDCAGKFSAGAFAYGDDFVLDELWDDCQAGDPSACDGLFAAAPFGSQYEMFGASCAGSREGDFTVPCAFVQSGEPFGYGDDPTFDLLWDGCSVGDGVACDDLFFQTPIGSAYEAFGRVCSDLTEVGHSCSNVAGWLGGPAA